MKKRILILTALLLLTFGVYYCIDPGQSFMPRCPFKLLTGLDCPACGNQRALHHLFHLRWGEAFRMNPFLFLSLPYVGALIVCQWFDPHGRLHRLRVFCHNRRTVLVYLGLLLAWWVVRNI